MLRMIDAISYFTGGACVPSGDIEAIPLFTNGLCIPTSIPPGGPIDSKGGIQWIRESRQRFIRKARQEAEAVNVILSMITIIENDRED